MKKVSGCIDVRALGCYNFEFYVDDDATDEEIEENTKGMTLEEAAEYYKSNTEDGNSYLGWMDMDINR